MSEINTNGVLCLPVAFAFWHHRQCVRTYRTKNELARIVVYWAVRHQIPCTSLTFDNWYASKHNLKFFDALGLVFITKLRHNARIEYDQTAHRVSWFGRFETHYYHSLDAYVRQFTVKYSGYGTGGLALVKNDKHAEPGRTKSLFSNALTLSMEQMQTNLRSLNCLMLPISEPQLVSRQTNGTLIPVTVDALLAPLRTRIPTLKELKTPTIQEMISFA